MKRVHVDVIVRLSIDIDKGIEIRDIIDYMDYDFTSFIEGATVRDSDMIDFEIVGEDIS